MTAVTVSALALTRVRSFFRTTGRIRQTLRTRQTLAIATLLLSACGVARATEATLVGDTFVSTAYANSNFGSLSNLYVSSSNTALLQFDLTSLPAGTTASQIGSATLTIYVNRVNTPGTITLQPITSAWAESSVTDATVPTLGAAVGTVNVTSGYEFYTIDVTSQVVSSVTASYNSLDVALSAAAASVVLDSKENDATGHPAQLNITLNAGAQGIQGPPGIQGPVASFQGGWSGTTAYTPGQAVSYNGSSYIAQAGSTGVTPGTNPSDWVVLAQSGTSFTYRNAWSASTTYNVNDVVSASDGSSYISLLAGNLNKQPAGNSNPSDWAVLAQVGAVGLTGATPAISVGSTTTGAAGTSASVAISGTYSAPILSFTVPQGVQGNTGNTGSTGPTGPPVNFKGNYVAGTAYVVGDAVFCASTCSTNGSSYIAMKANTNVDPPSDVSGSTGNWSLLASQGAIGLTGSTGATPAISVGSTTTGAAGTSASVAISGTSSAPILSFTVPQGIAATVNVGTVTTGAAGSSASVSNSGSTSAATLNFTIPQGAQGNPVSFKGGWSTGTAYNVGDAVICSTTCSTNGSSYIAMKANTSVDPSTDVAGNWSLLAAQGAAGTAGAAGSSFSYQGTYSATTAYTTGQVVLDSNGNSYVAKQGSTGATPSTSPSDWGEIAQAGVTGTPGTSITFNGAWSGSTTYSIGESVSYSGSSYISRVNSNLNLIPSSNPSDWSEIAQAGANGSGIHAVNFVTNIINPGTPSITYFFSPLSPSGTLPSSTAYSGNSVAMPVGCTISALNVGVSNNSSPGTDSSTVTVWRNGSVTLMTTTVNTSAGTPSASNEATSPTIVVAGGDTIALAFSETASSPVNQITIELVCQ